LRRTENQGATDWCKQNLTVVHLWKQWIILLITLLDF
jgi:hypothetical protein